MPPANTIRLHSDRSLLQQALPSFLRQQRWFGGKAQPIHGLELVDIVPFDAIAAATFLLLVRVDYEELSETYSIPLTETFEAASIPPGRNGTPAPHLQVPGEGNSSVFLYDATAGMPFLNSLLALIRSGGKLRGEAGEIRAANTPALKELEAGNSDGLTPKLMRAEQSNSSVIYGDRMVLKLFRRVEKGINPDLEVGWFLTEKTSYRNVPLLAGYLEYAPDDGMRMSLAILQSFVANRGDAWEFTLQAVDRYFECVRTGAWELPAALAGSLLSLAAEPIPEQASKLIGDYLDSAQLLGRRTAELHLALSSSRGDPAFDPEPFSPAGQLAFSESAIRLLRRNLQLLRQHEASLPADVREQAKQVLHSEPDLERSVRRFEERKLTALRTRIHGDYHLGQVLVSGNDFVLIDFEGEPARPLAERRRKQSPLQDVAGMLRSFHYAAYAPLLGAAPEAPARSLPVETYRRWADFWKTWVSAAFLQSYFATAQSAPFLPREAEEFATILEAHLLEKAVYELGYELNNRPLWVKIPLSGIAQLTAG